MGQAVSEKPAAGNQISPLAYLVCATTPLPAFLIMNADAETFIGRGQSERLRDALRASPHQTGVTCQQVKRGGHGSGTFQDAATTQIVVSVLPALWR